MEEYDIEHIRLYKMLGAITKIFNFLGLILLYGSPLWIGIWEGFEDGLCSGLLAGFGSLLLISVFLLGGLNFSVGNGSGNFLFYGLLTFVIYVIAVLLTFGNSTLHSLKMSLIGTIAISLIALLFAFVSAACTPPRPEHFTLCQECKHETEAWYCRECSVFVCFAEKCRTTHIHKKYDSKQS